MGQGITTILFSLTSLSLSLSLAVERTGGANAAGGLEWAAARKSGRGKTAPSNGRRPRALHHAVELARSMPPPTVAMVGDLSRRGRWRLPASHAPLLVAPAAASPSAAPRRSFLPAIARYAALSSPAAVHMCAPLLLSWRHALLSRRHPAVTLSAPAYVRSTGRRERG